MSTSLIVALDFDHQKDAMDLVRQLDPSLCRLKVGHQLFTQYGPAVVRTLVQAGYDVFLDLKYHDIPNTVAKSVQAAARLGVWMLNVHASGGFAMMRAARLALDELALDTPPLLVAVTILTSLEASDLAMLGIHDSIEQGVLRLAELAQMAGLEGIVCSVAELAFLREHLKKNFCFVTPGIRFSDAISDDQRRVETPQQAIALGSHYLVVGRPITQSPDPRRACEAILASVS